MTTLYKYRGLLWIVLLVWTTQACDSTQPEVRTKISGKVFESGSSNKPISGVNITTEPVFNKTTTDENGCYTITIPATFETQGNIIYRINASKEGYISNQATIRFDEGGDRQADITLERIKPILAVSPSVLRFEPPASNSLQFFVLNEGNGGSFDWEVGVPQEAWLQASPLQGTVSDNQAIITVTVHPAGLPTDTYRNFLSITSSNDAGTERVEVILVVN